MFDLLLRFFAHLNRAVVEIPRAYSRAAQQKDFDDDDVSRGEFDGLSFVASIERISAGFEDNFCLEKQRNVFGFFVVSMGDSHNAFICFRTKNGNCFRFTEA